MLTHCYGLDTDRIHTETHVDDMRYLLTYTRQCVGLSLANLCYKQIRGRYEWPIDLVVAVYLSMY